MAAARIFCFARTRRWAIVGPGTRKARTISGVCSPAMRRRGAVDGPAVGKPEGNAVPGAGDARVVLGAAERSLVQWPARVGVPVGEGRHVRALFPVRRPGSPLTEDALAQRPHALGTSPRESRNPALFTLAADVPAPILAQSLAIHIKAAIQWQEISGGDWAGYDADVRAPLEP